MHYINSSDMRRLTATETTTFCAADPATIKGIEAEHAIHQQLGH